MNEQNELSEEIITPLEEEGGESIRAFYRIRLIISTLWRAVSTIEERHPWLFFTGVSIAVFAMILGVISVVVNPKESQNIGMSDKPQGIENTADAGTTYGIDAARLLSNPNVVTQLVSPLSKIRREGLLSEHIQDPTASLLAGARDIEIMVDADLYEYLKHGGSREERYETYVSDLTGLEQRNGYLYSQLIRLHEANMGEITQATAEKSAAFSKLNTQLSTTATGEDIETSVNEYEDASARLARLQSDDAILADALRSTKPYVQRAQLRLAGIIANRESIIAGLQFIDIDGSGVALTKKGIARDYYTPSIDFGESSSPVMTASNSGGGIVPIFPNQGKGILFEIPQVKVLGLEEAYSGQNL